MLERFRTIRDKIINSPLRRRGTLGEYTFVTGYMGNVGLVVGVLALGEPLSQQSQEIRSLILYTHLALDATIVAGAYYMSHELTKGRIGALNTLTASGASILNTLEIISHFSKIGIYKMLHSRLPENVLVPRVEDYQVKYTPLEEIRKQTTLPHL